MIIKFLGTGSAFTMKNYQSNILIEIMDEETQEIKRLLIDAGTDVRFSLEEKNLSYKDIDAVYLSHLHADHVGGVEYFAFCRYFDPSCKEKIQLFGNSQLIRDAWEMALRGGLKSLQGKSPVLTDYFDVCMIPNNGSFIWNDITFEIVQSVHIMDGRAIVPTYGLMIHHAGQKIYVTGDTQYCPHQIMDFYKEADVIIQDCETYPFKSGVHANYEDLKTLPADIKAKMRLIHMNDNIYETKETVSKQFLEQSLLNGDQYNINNLIRFLKSLKRIIKPEWANKIEEDGFNCMLSIDDQILIQEIV